MDTNDQCSNDFFDALTKYYDGDFSGFQGSSQSPWAQGLDIGNSLFPPYAYNDSSVETSNFGKVVGPSSMNPISSEASSTVLPGPLEDDTLPGLEGWPLFECNPVAPAHLCPPTAKTYLQHLYSAPSLQGLTWSSGSRSDDDIPIEPLIGGTRDELIAIMQGFSNKAQRIHGLTSSGAEPAANEPSAPLPLILPPPHALDTLLTACLRLYELYYPFLCAASLKTNQPLNSRKSAVLSSLKLLLMMAGGAMTAVKGIDHLIAHRLLEIGRITFCNLVEEDFKLAGNFDMLQCALGYIIVAAWSGDKWQMDVGDTSCRRNWMIECIDSNS